MTVVPQTQLKKHLHLPILSGTNILKVMSKLNYKSNPRVNFFLGSLLKLFQHFTVRDNSDMSDETKTHAIQLTHSEECKWFGDGEV